ncbi:MAG: VOC family protein [Granulicella sp.]
MPTRLFRTLAMGLVIGVGMAAPSAEAQGAPVFNGIAHVAIRVSDLTASRDFYKKLGFDEAFALSRDGVVYESFFKINDRQFVEMYPVTARDTQIGFLHLCFEGADLNAIHDDYVRRGLTPNKVRTAGAGNLLFTMEGPEKQNIEYTHYMPASMHSKDVGKDLGRDRIGDKMVAVSLAMQDREAARIFYAKQLRFPVDRRNPIVFDLPGSSGEQVEIVSSDLEHKARVTLHASDLRRAEKHLREEKIPFTAGKNMLTVTDPDGNLLLVRAR